MTPGHGVDSASGRASSAVLALACAVQFMVVLDVSVVNVALPSIQRALGFDDGSQQWVVNAYVLPFAGFLLLGGRLPDLVGLRRVVPLGLALFSGASLVGGLATSAELLVAARAAQGLGAAVLAPASLTALTTTFPEGPRRTRALAAWTAVGMAGGTAGNLLGGVLTEYLSWRAVLLVNVPIGVVAALLAQRFPGRGAGNGPVRPLDVPGAVLATGALTSLTFGVDHARTHGWGATTTTSALLVGLAALLAFLVVEARFAREPLVPLRLFRVRAVSVGNAAVLLAGAALNPMWYFLTLVMQQSLHYSPLLTGLGFLPHTVVTIVVTALVTPWLMGRVGSRTLVVAGALVAAAGFWWQSRITADSGYLEGVLGPAVVFSLGSGLLNTPITTTVTAGVGAADAGAASGLMNTTKQFGAALGLAVLVTASAGDLATPQALAAEHGRAFLMIAAVLVVVAAVATALPAPSRDQAGQRPT
ncbi:MFS transporter [Saccharopolyspora hordei]|uniref:EmrB/QacA subfamily drug resistance transporter n=1 Tax=Saccharopolyspora hordei TaxID=1838 RepID=A0A853AI25_9PSEU|nr:MFS transporter [Saccharopolyspora hordei]NYI84272.1 EmrB/QacA subfamily drug resistance transporter [Saccharopolyspora hordei]